MTRACDQRQIRPLFAAAAILSIFLAACLFTGAPRVNAQAQDTPTLEERLAYIEGTLEQMNERLLELNHLTEKIDEIDDSLSLRIDKLYNTILVGSLAIVAAIVVQPFTQAYANKRFK